jgi:Type II CAAX prenyl endopeptidase Rce1-like
MWKRRTIYEIVAVIATALLHPLFVEVLHQRVVFIGLALVGWASYIGLRVWHDRDTLNQFGLRREGLVPAFVATSAFSAAALVAMALIAQARHAMALHWQMLLLLALYPVWGTLQQLLVQGVFVRAVVAVANGPWPKFIATAMAAILFGTVHLPDMKLAAATCLLGTVFTLIYLRWRNLWPLGLWHGWLGVFFYYWVLNRDPWAEVFGISN